MATETRSDELARKDRVAGKPILLGTLVVIIGLACMVVPRTAGRAPVVYLGLLLAASGVIEAVAGTRRHGTEHRSLILGGGMLSFAVGLLVATRPMAGVPAITLLLAGFFFAAGFAAVALSLLDRYPGWRWDCLFGVGVAILGIFAIWNWPALALWTAGYLLGLAILIRGATMMADAFEPDATLRQAPSRRT